MDRLLVTLCTYNERDNLPRLLETIRQVVPAAHVLVVDDASPDGTGEIADECAANDPRVCVIHRSAKLGLGSATVAAFEYAIARDFAWLINLDADWSHPPAKIPELLSLMESADVSIGSRYVPGGEIHGWRPTRHLMSRGVNWLTRTFLGLAPRDTSGSFRCYRVSLLKTIPFERIISHGYAFEEEILFRCDQAGARFAETPIRFEDRRAGESKISPGEVARALRDLGLLWLERLRSGRRSSGPAHMKAPLGKDL